MEEVINKTYENMPWIEFEKILKWRLKNVVRTEEEKSLMINCYHNFLGGTFEKKFNQGFDKNSKHYWEFGYKNCCICKKCNISCGEEMNADWYWEVRRIDIDNIINY